VLSSLRSKGEGPGPLSASSLNICFPFTLYAPSVAHLDGPFSWSFVSLFWVVFPPLMRSPVGTHDVSPPFTSPSSVVLSKVRLSPSFIPQDVRCMSLLHSPFNSLSSVVFLLTFPLWSGSHSFHLTWSAFCPWLTSRHSVDISLWTNQSACFCRSTSPVIGIRLPPKRRLFYDAFIQSLVQCTICRYVRSSYPLAPF